jgi:putative aldouronate transport system permease protein
MDPNMGLNHSELLMGVRSRASGDRKINIILISILTILGLVAVFPFYNVIITSFASVKGLAEHSFYILPYSFDLTSYKNLFKEAQFYKSFLVTVLITVLGVIFNMFLSVTGSYALSKKKLPGRNFILGAIIFTMFFSGGLIPYYLVINSLGLVNNLLVLVIPAGFSTMYLIIMKNYFNTIPESLEESAKIDGANEFYILVKIIMPISKPFMVTFALFYAVERWNEWWNAMLFINETSKTPLQIFLRNLLVNMSVQLTSSAQAIIESQRAGVYMFATQMAAIVISSIPIILVYPYLQKHFAKGIMIGSLKE